MKIKELEKKKKKADTVPLGSNGVEFSWEHQYIEIDKLD